MTFTEALDMELEAIRISLIQKNIQYGNSALNPLRIFSQASPDEQIKVRIDDKLSRIKNQSTGDSEDSVSAALIQTSGFLENGLLWETNTVSNHTSFGTVPIYPFQTFLNPFLPTGR